VYSKRTATGPGTYDTVIVVVNVDPHSTREATVSLDMPRLGMDWHERFRVRDELTGAEYDWGAHNYVRLDPWHYPAHLLTVRRSTW
jgi:starch synthase (maltosyl-transferring)